MTKNQIQELTQGYLDGTLLPDEWEQLRAHLMNDGNHPEFESELMTALEQKEYETADRAILERLIMKVSSQANSQLTSATVHRIHFLRRGWFKYAAAIIIIFGIGTYLWITNNKTDQNFANSNKQLQTDIQPGGNKAVLTLADGTMIILDSAANGNLAQQGGTQVVKLANGQIVYNVKGLSERGIMWNTMSTPAGGQYQITLPDGTKVWLNAASSITYPAAFLSKNRSVKITGEVYFEVAKNKEKPFLVDVSGKSMVEVLGTSFNINSYANEESIKTTLLEGSVKVNQANKSAIIKPGQQAQINNTNTIIVNSNVNIGQALAWKNGLFNFEGSDLYAVMRELERWYGIKVQYQGNINNVEFKGEMYRNVNLSYVLEMLKGMGVKFRLDGKILVVH